jgi:hypothetical protein
VRHRASDREPVGQVFLGDSLANGAGYATYLGREDVFPGLLGAARELLTGWEDPSRHDCDSACYDCLKDYWNLPFHGLLDWRLAGDLLDLMMHGTYDPVRRWTALDNEALEATREAFPRLARETFGQRVCLVEPDRNIVIIPRHPLEDPHPDHLSPELASVIGEVVQRGYTIEGGHVYLERSTTFDLLRRPAEVIGQAFGGVNTTT